MDFRLVYQLGCCKMQFPLKSSGYNDLDSRYFITLAKKARFGIHAACRWGLAYKASSIDLPHQSHTLDLALKASGARRTAAIQLFIKDKGQKLRSQGVR